MNEVYDMMEVTYLGGIHGRKICVEIQAPAKAGKSTGGNQLKNLHPEHIPKNRR